MTIQPKNHPSPLDRRPSEIKLCFPYIFTPVLFSLPQTQTTLALDTPLPDHLSKRIPSFLRDKENQSLIFFVPVTKENCVPLMDFLQLGKIQVVFLRHKKTLDPSLCTLVFKAPNQSIYVKLFNALVSNGLLPSEEREKPPVDIRQRPHGIRQMHALALNRSRLTEKRGKPPADIRPKTPEQAPRQTASKTVFSVATSWIHRPLASQRPDYINPREFSKSPYPEGFSVDTFRPCEEVVREYF